MFKQYIKNAEAKWKLVYEDIMHCRDPFTGEGGPAGFTSDEFKRYLRDVVRAKDVTDAQIKDIFFDLDVENKAFITKPVFVKEMSKAPRRQAYESAFDMKDVNRDGQLSQDEIANLLNLVGVEEDIAKKFFKEVDINKDGFISRKEFMKMV